MSEFPRGWVLTNVAPAGFTSSVTAAAIPGVTHVLDQLFIKYASTTATALSSILVQVLGAGAVVMFQHQLVVSNTVGSIDSASFSELDLAAQQGTSLGVVFTAATPTGYLEQIVAQGHDL